MSPDISRCPNCFSATTAKSCQQCGWQYGQENAPPALALGRMLDGRYRIGRVLGHGGFGITYLAWDDNLQLRLAIKEYLPRDCVSRAPDGVSLAVYSGQAGDQFTYGLDRFLEEARTLAHFDQHPGIVTVKNFFRAHGTGYCVMDYVAGITLRQYLDQQAGGRISVADALKLLMPVADALRAVHKEGLLHRDLAPDNIYLTQDGRIKLLDFGAARFAASEHSKSLSVILKPGYAPEEQYRAKGKQGPWTDVYGLAATFYRAITGQVPPESLDRLDNDDLVPPSRLGIPIKPEQEAILLKGLAVKAGQRWQGMAEMQQAWRASDLSGPHPASEPRAPAGSLDVVATPQPIKREKTGLILAISGGLFLLAILGVILWQTTIRSTPWLAGDPTPPPTPPTVTPAPPSSTPTPPPASPNLGTVADGEMAFDQGEYDRARSILRPLADAGDPVAQFYLGRMYAEGRGIEKDEVQGVNWYRKSAEQGYAKAENNLGVMYLDGKGIAKDEDEAARWYRKAADQGFPQAQTNLGSLYEAGQGVVKDLSKAVGWYRKAAEQGNALGQVNLGWMYAKGQGVAQDAAEAVRWYRKAAEQGYAEGQYNLGMMYDTGRGVAQDEAEAGRWYRKAADQGLAEGQFNLGAMYADGQGVTKDAAEAVRWFRKAAEQGVATAQFYLGVMYENGRGVTQDAAEAVRWFRKAADQGNADAQYKLGVAYDNGQGVAKDEAEAVRWYRKAADQGYATAQFNLGVAYANGLGVANDEAEAVRWYRKAAEQGDADAQFNIGTMYDNGQGITQDAAEAVRWYRKAAEQGDARGQFNLGVMYDEGQGVAKNEAEAVRWYRRAAEQGQAEGQVNLGIAYAQGRGVAQDAAEAVHWYRKAAEQGNSGGQVLLGVMYADGRGVTMDAVEAVRWYRKAAEQGYANGQFNLGVMYANGRGVAQDAAEAVRWYRKAAEQGDADGQAFLGGMYAGGRGVVKDDGEALRWFRKAAEQGHAGAQAALKELEDRMKSATHSNPIVLATAKALEDQLACVNNPEPGKAIRAMLANGTFKLTEFKGDGIPVLAPTSEMRVYGKKVKFVSGWEMENDGVRDPFSRAPGTAPPHFIEVIFDAKPSEINYSARQIRGTDGRLQYPYSTIDQTDEYYEKNGTTIICYGQYEERNSTEPATSTPIYFAAELAPTANIPPEAPLCYKFIVSSLEEQLHKIKTKYPALYDDKITTNGDGSRTLLAKRKDETGKVISYFYSTSPKVCNEYQKNHLAMGTPTKPTQPAANAPGPNSTSSQSGSTATDAKAAFDRRDYERAFALWRPLAQAGDAEAQNYFGYMYERGLGVAQDHGEAVRWYRKSAEQGLAEAQSNLGLSYVKGQGIAQNYVEGRHWFLKSAEQGFADAQYNLGRIYEKGVGVETDLAQARYWFRKAASQGQANARDALKGMGG